MIVGIAGPTCSGKSTIAQRIITTLPSDVILVAQDDFYKVQLKFKQYFHAWESIINTKWV
jgi:uridine kinase